MHHPAVERTAAPFPVGEDTKLKLSLKTVLAIIGFTAVAAASWFNIKADVSGHSQQLTVIQTTLGADHDQLQKQGAVLESQSKLLERIDRKIDYMTGAHAARSAITP